MLISSAAAAGAASSSLDTFALVMGLAGGLAIFLFGMEMMSDALKAIAGRRMKAILGRLTTNRVMGVFTGATVTAVIQSSSVTTVLVVGFISAGLMSMTQSVGVIMGANIGTTITAQIVAFKVTKYALLLVAGGFAMTFVGKSDKAKNYGAALLGLGLVFFGMGVMGGAMQPLRSFQPFLDMMASMENPALGILVGAAFTGLIQSSSATTAVVIVMAGEGLISLPAGLALAFGANIGTCVTALLACIGRPIEAVRAAVVHLLFNVLGVVIWLPIITHLADFVVAVSPQVPDLEGTAKLAAETPRQIANAHTIFNVVNTLIFLPFTKQFARAAEWLVKDRPIEEANVIRAKYLDPELMMAPSLALDRARLEILRMGDYVVEMYDASMDAVLTGSKQDLGELAEMDDPVDQLYAHIVRYMGDIRREKLDESDTEELARLMEAVNGLESIGDILETNLVSIGLSRVADEVVPSEETIAVIGEFHQVVGEALQHAIQAVTQKNAALAKTVVQMKPRINELAALATEHEANRLIADEPNRLAAYRVEIEVIENLKRVYYFCKRMARASVPGSTLDPGA